jgi:hypothetical protein
MFHLPLPGNQISMEPRVRLLRTRMMERGQGFARAAPARRLKLSVRPHSDDDRYNQPIAIT